MHAAWYTTAHKPGAQNQNTFAQTDEIPRVNFGPPALTLKPNEALNLNPNSTALSSCSRTLGSCSRTLKSSSSEAVELLDKDVLPLVEEVEEVCRGFRGLVFRG